MNNKANIQDLVVMMIIIFLAATVFLVVKYTYTEFVDKATNNTMINTSAAAVEVLDKTKELTDRFDYIVFTLLMGFTLAILISAYFSGGHPLFAFIYFIALALIVAISAVFSFVWGRITESAVLSSTATSFPIINLILDNFPVYVAIIGFLGMMIMFSRPAFSVQ